MNPFGSRGAADFASALDGGTAAALPGLALAARLRTVGSALDGAVAPRPEFRDALRLRLMAVATVQANAPAAAAPLSSAVSWRRRAGAVAAGAMASVVAVSGVAVAGSQSLPGDPFYGVKKTAEAFQLRTADGDLEKGAQHLEFAATRLREVRGLTLGRDAVDADAPLPTASRSAADADDVDRVRDTLAAMDDQTREGTELLTDAYRASRAGEPLRVLQTFATRQSEDLAALLPALPVRSQDRARISLALLTDVEQTTTELLGLGTCTDGCDPTQAAPTLPVVPGAPAGSSTEVPCDCAAPTPVPAPGPTAPNESSAPEPEPTPAPAEPEPSSAPSPPPASPAPSPSPSSGGLPVPVPSLPVPVPSLPVPVPTITFGPLAPVVTALDPVLPGTSSRSTSSSDPAPVVPSPLPQVGPLPARP